MHTRPWLSSAMGMVQDPLDAAIDVMMRKKYVTARDMTRATELCKINESGSILRQVRDMRQRRIPPPPPAPIVISTGDRVDPVHVFSGDARYARSDAELLCTFNVLEDADIIAAIAENARRAGRRCYCVSCSALLCTSAADGWRLCVFCRKSLFCAQCARRAVNTEPCVPCKHCIRGSVLIHTPYQTVDQVDELAALVCPLVLHEAVGRVPMEE